MYGQQALDKQSPGAVVAMGRQRLNGYPGQVHQQNTGTVAVVSSADICCHVIYAHLSYVTTFA